eukprot:26519_1
MSQLLSRSFYTQTMKHLSKVHISHFNKFNCLSHSSFSNISHDKSQHNPLYTSYANIKAASNQNPLDEPILSSSIESPLLSHLQLIDSSNYLLPIDWTNWTEMRQIFNKLLLYYINDFCDDFSSKHSNNKLISKDFIKRTQYMLIKTNIGGKNNRGLLHFSSVLSLRKHQNKSLTPTDIHNAFTIALCIEALQSYFLVMDDIVDQSETRRGQPCWYRYPNVGLKAVNDGPIIESWVYWLIHNRIINNGNTILIDRLATLFREVNRLTLAGQATDLDLVQDREQLRDNYTLERYEAIAMYKTSFYTFYLPYASALYLVGYDDKNKYSNVLKEELNIKDDIIDDGFLFHVCRQLSIELGIKFQIDDDFLDCFGDPEITGKIGTDIQDFKCSWIVVKALELMNDKQYEILKKHYGKNDNKDVEIVKNLFKELGLENVYYQWEMDSHNRLMNMIDTLDGILPTEMFTVILDKLHKRKK